MISDLGIVIVNWNSGKVILDCLSSIKKSGNLSDVIVVDNDSSDDSVSQIRKSFSEVKILQMRKNLGYGEGNNEGIKYFLKKGTKYILILNPDTLLEKSTIENLVDAMEKDKKIGIAGPKILISPPRGSTFVHPRGVLRLWSAGGIIDKNRYSGGLIGLGEVDNSQYSEEKEVDFISGTAMLVKSEVFEKAGFFPISYFMYYEDVEFCLKAQKAGFKVSFVPSSVIFHKESTSVEKDSPIHAYYMARNHLLFVERNAPIFIKIRELIRLPITIYEHIRRGDRFALLGIRDYFLRRFGNYEYCC